LNSAYDGADFMNGRVVNEAGPGKPSLLLAAACDESTLLTQLDEACQMSAALQRGLDMCTSINVQKTTTTHDVVEEDGYNTAHRAVTYENHPVARQLDELRHLCRQV